MEEQGEKGGTYHPLAGESERRPILGGLFWKLVDTPLHILSAPLMLLPPQVSFCPPPSSCISPPWENRDNKLAFFSRQGLRRRTIGQPSECPSGVPMDPSCPFPFQLVRKQSLCQHLSLRKLVKVMALLAISMATRRKEMGPAKQGTRWEIGGSEEKEWEKQGGS